MRASAMPMRSRRSVGLFWAKIRGSTVQYWDVRDPKSLAVIDNVGRSGALFAVAAYLGTTRLIDNVVVS